MKRSLSFLIAGLALALVSVACASSTPTPSAADVALTMLADQVNAQATQAKFDSVAAVTAQVVAATATQQAVYVQATQSMQARFDAEATSAKADANAQATAQQARMDAQATQQRLDFEATQVQARLDAEATAQQARLDLIATQQAAGTATAWSVTQAILPLHDSWTQQAIQADILLATNEVELSNIKVKQQRDTNVLQWLVPMLIAVLATVAGVSWLMSWSKVREVKDADGNVDALIIENEKVIVPKLLPKPVLMLDDNTTPDLTDPKDQAEIVKREQGIRALEVMPDHPSENAVGVYNDMFVGPAIEQKLPAIEFVTPDQVTPGVLDEIEGQVVEEAE